MPGLPPVEVVPLMNEGGAAWNAILTQMAWQKVDDLLAALFGRAA
jgi:hypothetical protein